MIAEEIIGIRIGKPFGPQFLRAFFEDNGMRLLFTMDSRDYDPSWNVYERPSARCISIRYGLVAMVHSRKFNYYKFPGGGIEKGESPLDALIRETKEEAGLIILPSSIRPYGYVHRIEALKPKEEVLWIQENFYYLCQTEEKMTQQDLDAYEDEEGYSFHWIRPETVIEVNRFADHGPTDQRMLEREARVLELLIQEGYLPDVKEGMV